MLGGSWARRGRGCDPRAVRRRETEKQRAVLFSLRDFQQKFQDVFVRCQDTGSRIATEFLPLGLYRATRYEHLEALGETFDARAAFEAVTGARA